MPVAPKSSPTKKNGAPKAKGAVRAKSGCYTCRIRRKKCDERANEAGHCQTCVRLRLQCLGFGAKRPEWLRESRNVVDLREKIKAFLAAQGMIKGHSGSGPRNAEQEPPMLRLADDYSSSSGSPPTPTLSLASVDELRPLHHGLTISAMRDQTWAAMEPTYSHAGMNSSPDGVRHESPYGSSQGSYHDMLHYQSSLPSSTSLVSSWPALTSSFSPTYHQIFNVEDDNGYPNTFNIVDDAVHVPSFLYMPREEADDLVTHYMTDVVDIQYLLVDSGIRNLIFQTVSAHLFSRKAVRLLAAVYEDRIRHPDDAALITSQQERYKELRASLGRRWYTADDAMAALHVVSSFLFDGGPGLWSEWLHVAYIYADNVLFDPRYHGPADALMHCDKRMSFVIKTAMWFDVLASVTTQKSPHFIHVFRLIFRPGHSGIDDPSVPPHPQLSMMSVMGCENHVVWAMAETSDLAAWKQDQRNKGCLSVPDLVARAADIEASLATQRCPEPMTDDVDLGRHLSRQLTAEVFRSSTRVYLRSVVSGDHPSVQEIIDGVEETISCLTRVPICAHEHNVANSVVRSTVYSIFVCGCLTDNHSHRSFLIARLNQKDKNVGNVSSVGKLMERVWGERDESPKGNPVRWREVLKESNMLLV